MPNKMRYKNINKIDCETFACEAHRKQFCTPQAFLCRVLARSMAHSHLTQLAPLTENQELLQLKSEEKPMVRNTINHGPNQKKRGKKTPIRRLLKQRRFHGDKDRQSKSMG